MPRPSIRAWIGAVLVAALAFAATFAVRERHRADGLHTRLQQLTLRQQVAVRASGAARALFTYDYRNLAATQQYLSSVATGGFAQRETSQSPSVQQRLRNAKAIGSAVVKEVTVSDVTAGHATAFVVVATKLVSAAGSSNGIVYLHLDLRLVGQAWKVDDVQNLAPR